MFKCEYVIVEVMVKRPFVRYRFWWYLQGRLL